MVFANAELRFPLIEAALTPIGVIGGIRGVFFAGIGGAWFNDQPSADPVHGRAATKFCDQQRRTLPRANRRASSMTPSRFPVADPVDRATRSRSTAPRESSTASA